jgi:ribosomal-protein-alanine N-acetyltransferase
MIRPFTFSDLDLILQIERQSFPKSPYDRATFVNLHYLYPETFWVYVDSMLDLREGQIVGYIVFTNEGHIISIAVYPQYRRRGIGKELLQKAINTLHRKKVWAEVRKSNQGAQAFYFHMGFQITGEIPNYYGNEDALIVRWILIDPPSNTSSNEMIS